VRDYRDTVAYDKGKYDAFVLGMQERGIRLIGRGLWYLSAARTTDEIDHAAATAREVLGSMDR
jgi:glutamate-1-semialdehyde 2,1-aminomutase